MKCPSCGVNLEAAVFVPDEQRFTLKLQYENQYLAAKTLGMAITNMERVLMAVAKDVGVKVYVMIESMSWGDNSVEIVFVIFNKKHDAKP